MSISHTGIIISLSVCGLYSYSYKSELNIEILFKPSFEKIWQPFRLFHAKPICYFWQRLHNKGWQKVTLKKCWCRGALCTCNNVILFELVLLTLLIFFYIHWYFFIVKINHMITIPDFTPGYISEFDLYFFSCRCCCNNLFTVTECSHATVQMIG